MENNEQKKEDQRYEKGIDQAVNDVNENNGQDLSQENIGNEPEERNEGDPESPYKLKGLDDKRPESDDIKKGWTVDSNTSGSPDDNK